MLISLALAVHSVLWITLDDWGTDKIGIYEEGDPVPTPILDALATSGRWYRNFRAMPLCSPSRACALTGRYPFRTGITGNIGECFLPESETTLPERMAEAGYRSWLVGKWHLGHETGTPLNRVGDAGFTGLSWSQGDLHDYELTDRWSCWPGSSAEIQVADTSYQPETDAALAVQLIEHTQGPWFGWVNLRLPHAPIHTPPQHLHTQGFPEDHRGRHKAMVEAADSLIGQMLAVVDLRTTVVMIWGDNGTKGNVSDFPNDKGTVTEGGCGVPLLVFGAGIQARGEVRGNVSVVDLHATTLALAGLTSSAEDSIDFSATFTGGSVSRTWDYQERRSPIGGPYDFSQEAAVGRLLKVHRDEIAGTETIFDFAGAGHGEEGAVLQLCELTPEQLLEYGVLRAVLDRNGVKGPRA